MANEAEDEKFEKFMMSMAPSSLTDLRRVAKENRTSIQELLRLSADAIIRLSRATGKQTGKEFGEIPKDMELRQRRIAERVEEIYEANKKLPPESKKKA